MKYRIRPLSYLIDKFGKLEVNKNGYYSFENSIFCIDPKMIEHEITPCEGYESDSNHFVTAKQVDSYGNNVYFKDYLEEEKEELE